MTSLPNSALVITVPVSNRDDCALTWCSAEAVMMMIHPLVICKWNFEFENSSSFVAVQTETLDGALCTSEHETAQETHEQFWEKFVQFDECFWTWQDIGKSSLSAWTADFWNQAKKKDWGNALQVLPCKSYFTFQRSCWRSYAQDQPGS